MPETPKPSNEQAFKNFVEKYNLEPLNLEAINNCLFAQQEQINEIARNINIDYGDFLHQRLYSINRITNK